MKILLVCTGNTCRSPLAEVLLRRALQEVGAAGVGVASAGTGAFPGEPASEGSYLVALEHGLDLTAHRARVVNREMLSDADLVLTMGRGHLRKLELLGAAAKSSLIGDYAGSPGEHEVADPVGGPIEGYREAFVQLEAMSRAIAKRIAAEVRGGQR